LGIDDQTFVWFLQIVGKAVHIIRTKAWTGKGLPEIATDMKALGYNFSAHVLPHDIKARELGTGRSRFEVLSEHLDNIFVCPMHKVEDGIEAVKGVLKMCYMDHHNTEDGRLAMRNYHRSKAGKPVHNWASHAADAFRVGAMAFNMVTAYTSGTNIRNFRGPLRRRIRGIK
jgi:hypothetical protein